jgi:lipooligosaccharide transport system ATP-binding protein
VIMDYGRILVEGKPDALVREYIGTDIVEVEHNPRVVACLTRQGAKYDVWGGTVQVYTTNPQEVIASLLNECELGTITARAATLEDVFLKLTGKKLRE